MRFASKPDATALYDGAGAGGADMREDRKNGAKTAARGPRGQFARGNPGRPRGARNAATRLALALIEGEAEGLARKLVAQALEGDPVALRLAMERLAPPAKDAPIEMSLPLIESAEDAARAAAAVLGAVAEGEITPIEGARIMDLIEAYRRTLETTALEARLAALEARA
jgi:hypothetical protein